jgi:hypothetical protein
MMEHPAGNISQYQHGIGFEVRLRKLLLDVLDKRIR